MICIIFYKYVTDRPVNDAESHTGKYYSITVFLLTVDLIEEQSNESAVCQPNNREVWYLGINIWWCWCWLIIITFGLSNGFCWQLLAIVLASIGMRIFESPMSIRYNRHACQHRESRRCHSGLSFEFFFQNKFFYFRKF